MNKKEYKFLAYNEDIPHPTEIELIVFFEIIFLNLVFSFSFFFN